MNNNYNPYRSEPSEFNYAPVATPATSQAGQSSAALKIVGVILIVGVVLFIKIGLRVLIASM